jgi:hypothetical protein
MRMRSLCTVGFVVGFAAFSIACGSANDESGGPGNPGTDDDAGTEPDDTNPPPPATIDGYPVGPYGFVTGQVFPNITLQGYVGGAGPWTTITTKDYFDVDGSKGIDALMITIGAPWCAGCTAEGASLPDLYRNKYEALGARFLAAIVQDASSKPATQSTVDAWVKSYKTNYDIAADPDLLTVHLEGSGGSGSLALPYDYVIDPRTMRIKAIDAGIASYGATIPGLDDVLKKNSH